MSACYHCGQAIKPHERVERSIQGKQQAFCCHGCASVCEVIHESGLDSFYRLSPQTARPSQNKRAFETNLEFYDYDEVQSAFVKDLSNHRSITLMSDAIHCAACIWLIEHSLAKLDGVLHANVNFTNKQIKIRWDNQRIKLSDIIRRLGQIGYDAKPYDAAESEKAYRKANRDLLYRLGFAGFAVMNAMWFSVALYTGAQEDDEYRSYFYLVLFLLASVTLIYSAQPFFKGAWQSLKAKTVGMDVSISLGLLVTYGYSTWIMLNPQAGQAFFATVIDLTFLLLVGRYLEAISKNKALDATRRLMDLQPKVARKLENNIELIVPVRLLKAGDCVQVKPGDKFPVDGCVIAGQGQVNESMLSGESREVYKQEGSTVAAGTINLDGSLTVRVESTLEHTKLGRIIHLVEEAQGSKATIQCTAEKIMPWFVSVTLALAALSFTYWWIHDSLELAIMAGTTVLIITCPCALGLATPMAMAVASGVAARNGILVKHGVVLEMLNELDHFVFDKTGTLTKGKMKWVDAMWQPGLQIAQWLPRIALIEQRSEHSLGRALVDYVAQQQPNWRSATACLTYFKAIPGRGVEAQLDATLTMKIGTADWLVQSGIRLPDALVAKADQQASQGRTSVWVAADKDVIGVIFVEDALRDDAFELIDRLKQRGKQVTLLSGDRYAVAEAVAKQLGGMAVIAEVLPEDKSDVIRQLQAKGQKVAMVGDGVNDAPALSRAQVGFALGAGTDVSMDSADIVLLNNELLSIDAALDLSAYTLKTVKQNILMSISYNVVMVPLAMAAMLTPLIASITMPLSSLAVIFNAMRIRRFFKPRR
ncbi:MAG: heavy metal translocating P-type ATPase [Thiomicrospira sp.]|jgi:Cu2+-exporting ATPase|nr:heavy metal translocating P-type ATPase [Thiomicrospira sp.]